MVPKFSLENEGTSGGGWITVMAAAISQNGGNSCRAQTRFGHWNSMQPHFNSDSDPVGIGYRMDYSNEHLFELV